MSDRNVEDWLWQLHGEKSRPAPQTQFKGSLCWTPRVDIYERADAYVLVAELAGVHASDIRVSYLAESHEIQIRGSRGCSLEDARLLQLEIETGSFERTVSLGRAQIDPVGIQAEIHNGLLRITLPRSDSPSRPTTNFTVVIVNL